MALALLEWWCGDREQIITVIVFVKKKKLGHRFKFQSTQMT